VHLGRVAADGGGVARWGRLADRRERRAGDGERRGRRGVRGTQVDGDQRLDGGLVFQRQREVDLAVGGSLLPVRQEVGGPAPARRRGRVGRGGGVAGRQHFVGAVVGVAGEADLFEVVLALQACRRAADLLDGGHE